jgi:hypothetical protein
MRDLRGYAFFLSLDILCFRYNAVV